jgi:Flp pilus assembly protein TadB
MTQSGTGWPRGRTYWLLGSVVLFASGVLFGLVFQNVWLGVILAAVVSLGWLIAFESSRGRNVGVNDPDNGVEL